MNSARLSAMRERSLAAGDEMLPFSALQIWPPTCGFSSTMATDASANDAAAAAARPAGPAPTMTMSKFRLSTGDDAHSIADRNDTTALVRLTVDDHAALEANAHTA